MTKKSHKIAWVYKTIFTVTITQRQMRKLTTSIEKSCVPKRQILGNDEIFWNVKAVFNYMSFISNIFFSGNTFAPRAYAMAYRSNLNQSVADRLHKVILQMQEEGDLDALEKKWFVDKGECWNVSRVCDVFEIYILFTHTKTNQNWWWIGFILKHTELANRKVYTLECKIDN